ncbi:hypothetical protein [Natronoglycomyces albus]|uniref:Uncharacterized protein n=1 Tax=Natronoglycomyces albus TaxID=2811108 RepID=A0A895XQW4_9ACTN|nr:hypothetical protein [Natronoglycomyces albus]QSB03958.1 hypothetical protein JQS30_08980 [Natronoglycomyces albus]
MKFVKIALVSVMLIVAACSQPAEKLTERERSEISSVIEYGYSQGDELEKTLERLARLCMEDKGFDIHPGEPDSSRTPFPASFPQIEIRMGIQFMYQDEEFIQENGYGRSPSEMHPDMLEEPGEFLWLSETEQDKYYRELNGSDGSWIPITWPDGSEIVTYPTEGCMGEVYHSVFGEEITEYHQSLYYAYDAFTAEAMDSVFSNRDLENLEIEWSSCMAAEGFPGLEDPQEAAFSLAPKIYNDAGVNGPDDDGFSDLKSQEIELATADYYCNSTVGLDEARIEIFWDSVGAFLKEYEVQIFAWSERVEEANKIATEMLQHLRLNNLPIRKSHYFL